LLALGRQAARELELRQHVALLEHEILERAATEEALFEREEQLRLFIDHTPLAVAMFDREMRYLLVSDSWLQLSHLTRDALHLFEEHGTLVVEDDVLMIEGTNKLGELARIAQKLSAAKINIEYCYSATPPGAKKGLLILRVSNPAKALKALNL
ncbi:MAG TPA: hypothetical protein VNT26_11110, partial [Candidatus Sulfotelmatobacter sp.]|nr:hypothetical protein [Candidatus Sulfotelmatobacter sp.]